MLDRATIFKAEQLETDIAAREIVFSMGEHEIPVLEGPHDVDPRRGPGQALKQHSQPLAALVGLRIVLDVFRLVDHRDRRRVSGFYAFQQRADPVLVRCGHGAS